MRAHLRLTHHEDDEPPEFQLAPMIDVVFQLLVFFICASKIDDIRYARKIQLPVASSAMHNEEGKLERTIIDLQWDHTEAFPKLSINAKEISLNDATPMLKEMVKRNPSVQVVLRADSALHYRFIREVMETCSRAGVSRIAFASLQSSRPPPPPPTITP